MFLVISNCGRTLFASRDMSACNRFARKIKARGGVAFVVSSGR